jgi:hypothetical protein
MKPDVRPKSFVFDGVTLEVEEPDCDASLELDEVLDDLLYARALNQPTRPSLRLCVRLTDNGSDIAPVGCPVFSADGFRGLESGKEFYLTDGCSTLYLQGGSNQAIAFIASSFFAKEGLIKRTFWAFALLKLLRARGFYSLHAAGLVTTAGWGLLIVGPSGCGKSTLTHGMIRRGWSVLSDDALLLRAEPDGVKALALRKYLYIDSDSPQCVDLPPGMEETDHSGRCRRKISIEESYPGRQLSECSPANVLIFPRIVQDAQSSLVALDDSSALKNLLLASGPQLFDRRTLAEQLEVLKLLLRQVRPYELWAGMDLYQEPSILEALLEQRS